MKRLIASSSIGILIILGIFTSPGSVNAMEADKLHDGYWWECVGANKAAVEKIVGPPLCQAMQIAFIRGYVEGIADALGRVRWFEKIANEEIQNALGPVQEFEKITDEEIKKFILKTIMSSELDRLTFGQLQMGVSEFYSDFRNMQIPFDDAIQIVKDEIRGEKKEYIECKKEVLRLESQGKVKEPMKRFDQCLKKR